VILRDWNSFKASEIRDGFTWTTCSRYSTCPRRQRFHSPVTNPSDSRQDVDRTQVTSGRQRRLRSRNDTIRELPAIFGIHGSTLTSSRLKHAINVRRGGATKSLNLMT
jgi:hypothetical protein